MWTLHGEEMLKQCSKYFYLRPLKWNDHLWKKGSATSQQVHAHPIPRRKTTIRAKHSKTTEESTLFLCVKLQRWGGNTKNIYKYQKTPKLLCWHSHTLTNHSLK